MANRTKKWRIVAYDIRDPKRYRAAYRIIRGQGRRIQYSMFRCQLDDRSLEKLRYQLMRVLEPEDSLLIFNICARCAESIVIENEEDQKAWALEPPSFRILGG